MGTHKHYGQLDPPTAVGCVAWRNTTQTINSATDTALLLNSEAFDTHGFHSTTTNTSRLTIPTGMGGLYLVSGAIRFANNPNGGRVASIRLNGGIFISQVPLLNAGDIATGVPTQAMTQLAAGDYVELFAWHSVGAALSTDVGAGTSLFTWLGLTRLGI